MRKRIISFNNNYRELRRMNIMEKVYQESVKYLEKNIYQ